MLGAVLVIILCCFTATNGTCWYYSSSNSIRCTGMSQSCSAATPTLGTGLALPKGIHLLFINALIIYINVINEYTN